MAYTAKSMGISNDYRSATGIASEDFSDSQMERWQKRAGKIISIEQGVWYWPDAFGDTTVRYVNQYGAVSRLTYSENETDWSGCKGRIYFDAKEKLVNSEMSPSCLTKRIFKRSLTKLISNSVKQVTEEEEKIYDENRMAQSNLSTWRKS